MTNWFVRAAANQRRVGQALSIVVLAASGVFGMALSQDRLRTATLAVALVALALVAVALVQFARFAFVGMFALAYFVFLLGRWIATLSSDRLYTEFSPEVTRSALVAVFVGIVCVSVIPVVLLLGKEKGDATSSDKAPKAPSQDLPGLVWVLLAVVATCGGLRIVDNLTIARHVWDAGYASQYVWRPGPGVPALHYLSLMYDALFAVFISWRPRRLLASMGLLLHLAVVASSLLTGQRIYAVVWIAVLVSFVACAPPPWLRLWVRRHVLSVVVATAVALVLGIGGLSAVEALRSGAGNAGVLASQGVSYVVVAYADERAADLPDTNDSYTFGRLAARLTGETAYPPNSVVEATHGNNLGATISWLVQPTVYAVGGGFGTSYIADLTTDFGVWGVGVYSLVLGGVLVACSSLVRRRWLTAAATILLARSLLIMPRDFALNWVFPFLSASVLVPLVASFAAVYLARRFKSRASA